MPVMSIPFHHAGLGDLLMIEWSDLSSFGDYRRLSKCCLNVLIYKEIRLSSYRWLSLASRTGWRWKWR